MKAQLEADEALASSLQEHCLEEDVQVRDDQLFAAEIEVDAVCTDGNAVQRELPIHQDHELTLELQILDGELPRNLDKAAKITPW